jgi:hypothetical protein
MCSAYVLIVSNGFLNSYILEAREMPFLSMLETIFYKIMQRNEESKGKLSNGLEGFAPKSRRNSRNSLNGAMNAE